MVPVKHGFCGEGEASSLISGLYFNRALSSWEPFLDPWKCAFDWRIREDIQCCCELHKLVQDLGLLCFELNVASSSMK